MPDFMVDLRVWTAQIIAIFWRRNLDSTVLIPEQFSLTLPEGYSLSGLMKR
jgi:hypothetical protein